jgi:hypothetical protein
MLWLFCIHRSKVYGCAGAAASSKLLLAKGAKLFSSSAGFMLPALLSYRGRCWLPLSVVVVVVVEVKAVVKNA